MSEILQEAFCASEIKQRIKDRLSSQSAVKWYRVHVVRELIISSHIRDEGVYYVLRYRTRVVIR
jgi:hypothetical protein